jgi:hypothetical protein
VSEHHDGEMRTTLTLDPDVVSLIEEEVHRRRTSFEEVVNDAIRRSLSPRAASGPTKIRVKPHETRLKSGIDRATFNRRADELENAAVLAALRPRRKQR